MSNAQANFAFADSLFAVGNWRNAALEYERQGLNATEEKQLARAMFSKSLAYKKDSAFLKAAQTLERVPLEAQKSVAFYYEKTLCYYLAANFEKAQETLNDMYDNMESSADFSITLPLQVLVLNELHKYSEAQAKLKQIEDSNRINYLKAETLNILYEKPPRLKSEKTARILSFIPGFGHMYSSEYMKGAFAFLLNAGILTFGIHQVINGYYFTAYLAGAGILSGTYFGSMKRSEFLVKKYNYSHSREFNDKVRKIMFE